MKPIFALWLSVSVVLFIAALADDMEWWRRILECAAFGAAFTAGVVAIFALWGWALS